ncbi:MAG: ORF6N domain-containing protein [Candidatus Zixiibacteriota bacterium]|nr:MAG: ORF6N domain-containing protein [candidate division Zixibacteria bacterium]
MNSKAVLSRIENKIYQIRNQRVMLDNDLAELYGVTTKRLNEQVKRNLNRFPEDFMFQLTKPEWESLRSQFATSKNGRGGRRYYPRVFTEHGAIMLASVLNSERAVNTSIFVVRVFIKLREQLSLTDKLSRKIIKMEKEVTRHDKEIVALFTALKQLISPPAKPKKRIGFEKKE